MLTGQSMIYFAPGPWQGLWRNRHQLMHRFARAGNRVLFVEGRNYLRSTLAAWRNGEIGAAEWQEPPVQEVDDNLFVFRYPLWMPVSGRLPLGWITQRLRALHLRKTLASLGMAAPIVWFSQPGMGDLLAEMPMPRLRLYHVVDEYSAYTGQSLHHSQHEAQMEARLLQAVDAVIVVSQKLYDAKRAHHPHTYLVPNGVDFDAYSSALADPTLPDDLARIASPRIGYSGLIGDRLNLPMLHELAQSYPAWSLVLIGEARLSQQANAWMALLRLPNVHYLGEKSVERVPHYLKGFDVGLMPYQQNRESDYISPLKLYDYLAAGVAVASVEIPAIDCFRPYIHVAPTPASFTDAVDAALADSGDERQAVRRSVAAQHTWDARVQQLSGVIEQQLGQRAKVY
jgi:hypothetical protein